MTEDCGMEFGFGTRSGAVSRRCLAVFAFQSCISQFPPTRLLRIQQSASNEVQVGQRSGPFQPVQVLRQTPIADLLEAEDVLDHAEHVLDFGTNSRLVVCCIALSTPALMLTAHIIGHS